MGLSTPDFPKVEATCSHNIIPYFQRQSPTPPGFGVRQKMKARAGCETDGEGGGDLTNYISRDGDTCMAYEMANFALTGNMS